MDPSTSIPLATSTNDLKNGSSHITPIPSLNNYPLLVFKPYAALTLLLPPPY